MVRQGLRFRMTCAICLVLSFLFLGAMKRPLPHCRRAVETPDRFPTFIFGASHNAPDWIPYVQEMHMKWMRPEISWKEVMPEIPEEPLTVEEVDANPQMVIDLMEQVNWAPIDARIATYIEAGITPFTVVGHGYRYKLPQYRGETLTPDAVGEENYLGYLYLYARAAVERFNGDGEYDAPNGAVVKYWQLENELNQAYLTAMWGWRAPAYEEAFGSAWRDFRFLTKILETLQRAVKTEDPEATTMTNFHTDIPAAANHIIGTPSWEESVVLWRDLVDVIGMDAYPNYYTPTPVMGEVVGERVARVRELACGKEVLVVETGYPTGPTELGFTPEYQAEYIEEAFTSAKAAGAAGFFQFGVLSPSTHTTEITEEDVANLQMLGEYFMEGRIVPMVIWALRNIDYIFDHFLDVLQSVEYYWGVIGPNDVHYPGFYLLRDFGAALEAEGE